MNRKHVAIPYLIWMVGFVLLPLVMVVVYAFTDKSGAFTFANVTALFEPVHAKALWLSLLIAVLTTAITLLLAYPLALALRRLKVSAGGITLIIMILPMWMNFVLRVMAWQTILSKNGLLNLLLTSIGLEPLNIINTWVAILIGMVYDFLPYMILPVYTAVMEIPENILEAARDLGAGSFTVALRIILPMTRAGAMSGVIMVFVPSMTAFVVSNILGGGKIQLLGNIIEQEFVYSMNWNLGSGLSLTLMIFALLGLFFTQKNDDGRREKKLW